MKVTSISITGLFRTFNHRIPLFSREPITIIHGPNGIGKTSILRLIYGSLRPAYSHLYNIPFHELELAFDNGTSLLVIPSVSTDSTPPHPRQSRRRAPQPSLQFVQKRNGQAQEKFTYTPSMAARFEPRLEATLPFLRRIGPDEWIDAHTDSVLSHDEILQLYGPDMPEEFRVHQEPEWLRHLQQDTPVHFIETQRLLDTKPRTRPHPRVPPQQPAVKRCSSEFAEHIKSTLAKSATLSQSLERTFPARLISEEGPLPPTEDQIRQRLSDLDSRRSRLVDAGLLDPGFEPPLPAKRFDETTKRVLAVYILDTEQKLAIFDELLSRIELIKSIVDSRFLQKSLTVNREQGFVVTARDGRPVELSNLSSGEQHELVLLYELLFQAEKGTLILIDEPELSLHIAWQQQFLRDLLQITRLAQLQVLIATHSPQIIHDRWDLTVELLGPTN